MIYEVPEYLQLELDRHDNDFYANHRGRTSETIKEWLDAEYNRGFQDGVDEAWAQ